MKCPHCQKEFSAKEAKIRSIPENNYYFGVVVEIISEEIGESPNDTHEILKDRFLKKNITIHTKSGVQINNAGIGKSTAELSTVDFEKYLSDIREWASMFLHCYIPLPNEELNA